MDETKASIRREMRRRRRALTPTEVAAAGAAVAAAVLGLDAYRAAAVVLAYVDAEQEVPTGALIASALASGKRVFLPRLDGERMVFAEHRLGDALQPGALGIPAPQGQPAAEGVVASATAFVPVVAWDDAGGRIGRGGGHYDRTFAGAVRPSCLVGLAYAFQQLPRVPHDPWDVRLDCVVSERGAVKCWNGDPVSPHSEEVEQHHGIPGHDRGQPGDRRRAGGPDGRLAAAAG
ncbi:MAG: 5-formyltetrahydrofolate cyclo-ligase [Candidatus Binatia bacterium]